MEKPLTTLQDDPSSFPELITARLKLRGIAHDDIDEIHFLRSDATVLKHIKNREPATRAEAQAWIERVVGENERRFVYQWALVPHGSEKLIGTICFWQLDPENNKAELGYTLHPDFHGKGYMQEALKTVLRYGHEHLQLELIEAITHEENLKSRALLERNGFARDAELECKRKENGEEPHYACIYTLRI
jgi:[ribosomal protein S5]-alanine N-acetyltransferase